MKRKGNLYDQIISMHNLRAAAIVARRGKGHQPGVIEFLKNEEGNILALHAMLGDQTYKTSPYHNFPVFEPKERLISKLPFFPDRIVHHAIMNVLEAIFVASFTADTYSCIKGRGIYGAFRAVKRALQDQDATQYCLKMDVRQFYPSVDHKILKRLLRRKFKDERLLRLLDEIIDSAPGLPIGNYLSQYFANYYLTGFDHWLKENMGVRHYFRYADDLVIFARDKASLHRLRAEIHKYISLYLNLDIKKNYQVFPVWSRGLDFVGYRFYHTHVLLRKSIKKNFARMMFKRPTLPSFYSYNGWAAHCNSRHLFKTLLQSEKFQRLQNSRAGEPIHRGQYQDRKDPEPANNSIRLQNRRLKIRKRKRKVSNPGLIPGRGAARPVYLGQLSHGSAPSNTQGEFPFRHHNSETK